MRKGNLKNLSVKRIRKKMSDMPDKGHQMNAYWTTFSPPPKKTKQLYEINISKYESRKLH